MHANEFMIQAAGERNFNELTLSEAKLVKTSQSGEEWNGKKLDGATAPDGALLLAPIYFLAIAGTLIYLKLSKSSPGVQNRITALNPFYQVPCNNCRFFTNNQYLKCAVHPSTVLKQQAINCPDYWPQDGKFSQ